MKLTRRWAWQSLALAFAFLASLSLASAREAKPALWKIDGPTSDIYLFGSFHILPKGLVWRTPELEAALQTAGQLDFEIDLDAAQNPQVMGALIQKLGFLPPGESLHKMLAKEHREKLDATLKELGLPPEGIDRMRPWLVAITITSLSALKQTSKPGSQSSPTPAADEQGGVDQQLWSWAKANNKQRGALETVEQQLHIFADLSRDQEVQYLIVTLQQISKLNDDLATLLNAWRTGDVAKLDKELNGDTDHFPMLRQALFDERHARWMPQIESMLSDGNNHVIIVGVAHLVGKGSLVDLLRRKGVKVEGP